MYVSAVDVQHSNVRFLGSLVLNLWDCGGQDAFYESYFESRREDIFRNVAVLIYVFDIESRDLGKDMAYYDNTVQALSEYSPDAQICCLIHKMDLIPEADRERVFGERSELIRSRSLGLSLHAFATSIWDETLFRAWSSVVHSLIPNVKVLENSLEQFAEQCEADEVVLFERASFLVISSVSRRPHGDRHRFEKISNIVKQFKLTCSKGQGQFQGMRVGNSTFTAIIDAFTSNTYLLVVSSDPAVPEEATLLNISLARPHFSQVISEFT